MTHTAKLIRIYFCFIKKDILESAIYGRDWDFIYNHMKALHSYMVYTRGPIGEITNKDILLNKVESALLNTYTSSDKSCLEECILPKDSYSIELEHFSESENTTLSRSLFDSMDIL